MSQTKLHGASSIRPARRLSWPVLECASAGSCRPARAMIPALTNFSDVTQSVDTGITTRAGLHEPAHVHSSTGQLSIREGRIELAPWSFLWLTGTPNAARV